MSKTFDQGREEIAKLCKYFATNRQAFFAPGVKEAHIRQNLIDPFFGALGWDVHNKEMIAPQLREVIPEDSLEIEGQQKAPDYTFRAGPQPKFFTEAKKCGINISADPGPAYQLRRYGWSAKVALSILTDFEEMGVYDCSLRPRPTDKASFGRIQYFRDEEYPDRWKELWEIFSREAIWSGAYDKFAASKRSKHGTSEVDSEFLKEIEGWRDSLARNIALRNQFFSPDDLNAAVQRTIDRVIFLRMAEDRGSEPYGQLLKLCEQPDIYYRFMNKSCKSADEKYNSGLFHFRKEEGITESLDSLTPKLQVDDKVFKPILQSLYFEHGSPYHFGVLPVEILGTVYERFLGKVIRLTADHRAKVEEKPEVRKAGGVYYTPAYIVNYIVINTVGKMIEGKNPAQLASGKNGQPLRVLDMACGSGSFLLGAFQYLLDHCLKWYLENRPEKYKEAVYLDSRRKYWRLTIGEKKRILITHVFGIDIDPQAVEVSKLSLLLKVLEGETDETVGQSRQLFHERALPNLYENIKCGNSLIGPDYFSGRLIPDPDEMKRVNPFAWQREFPNAMKSGGFDCVIGNPPYVRQESLGDDFKSFVKEKYDSYAGTADLYVYFIEQSLKLLRANGNFGFICSNKWMRANYGRPLRDLINKESKIEQIIDFGELPVFQGAATFPAILLLKKEKTKEQNFIFAPIKRLDFTSLSDEIGKVGEKLNEHSIKGDNWTLASSREVELFEKMCQVGIPLGEYVNEKIYRGVLTGLNEAFVIDRETRDRLISEDKKSAELIKPFVRGDDVRKYFIHFRERYLIFTRHGINIKMYPAIEKYLFTFKDRLTPKPANWTKGEWKGRKPGSYNWYEIQDTIDYYKEFEKPKIVFPDIAKESRMAFDLKNVYIGNTGYIIPTDDLVLLGILNSKLIFHFYKRNATVIGDADKGGRLRWIFQDVRRIPIRSFNTSKDDEKLNVNSKIKERVKSIIDLNNKLHSNRSERESELLQRQIDSTSREIDQLVYELYGLTKDEIKIVEEKK